MKRCILALVAAFFLIVLPGCGNLSPRNDQKIDNQNGKIDEIRTNQNGVMAEILSLKNKFDIHDSTISKIQQGMVNLQSNNENSGVQILSGPGGLVVAMIGFLALSVIALHFRGAAKANEKTANILAEKIVQQDDPALEDSVFQAAMYTDVEENVLNLIKKHKT